MEEAIDSRKWQTDVLLYMGVSATVQNSPVGEGKMTEIGDAFHGLADVLEVFQTTEKGYTLTAVTPVEEDVQTTSKVSVKVNFEIPLFDASRIDPEIEIKPSAVSLTDKGDLDVTLLLTALTQNTTETSSEEETSPDENTRPRPREKDTNGDVAKGREAKTDHESSLPAYRDPDRLREVYEVHDTFKEMTDALNVEVTWQTVRRYMIKHDIHKPSSAAEQGRIAQDAEKKPGKTISETDNSNTEKQGSPLKNHQDVQPETENSIDTDMEEAVSRDGQTPSINDESQSDEQIQQEQGSDEQGQTESPQEQSELQTPFLEAEDAQSPNEEKIEIDEEAIKQQVEIPKHLSLDDIQTAVRNAKTLYEVQDELGLDRTQARDLLRELNLLDLVQGRLATRELQDRTLEEINKRIQETTTQLSTHS
ncbi:hypothetical protein [Halorussus salinus]|uniref:hypothetical protein n=1 Tax=Halorussus salinus TaxID=1364935 RepID=UPI00109320AC|nr:hypothetical protein [Halorussus salinus]